MSHNEKAADSDGNNSRAGQSTQAQASSTSGEINRLDAPRVLSDEATAQQSEDSKLDNTAASEKQTKSNITNGQNSDTNSPKQLPSSKPPEQINRNIQQRDLSIPLIANQYLDVGTRTNQNGQRSPIAQPQNQQPTNLLTDNAPENSLICLETGEPAENSQICQDTGEPAENSQICQETGEPVENSQICQEIGEPVDDSQPGQENRDITAIEHLQVCVPATSLEEPDLPLCYQFISLENRGLPRFSYLLVIYSTQNLPQPNLM